MEENQLQIVKGSGQLAARLCAETACVAIANGMAEFIRFVPVTASRVSFILGLNFGNARRGYFPRKLLKLVTDEMKQVNLTNYYCLLPNVAAGTQLTPAQVDIFRGAVQEAAGAISDLILKLLTIEGRPLYQSEIGKMLNIEFPDETGSHKNMLTKAFLDEMTRQGLITSYKKGGRVYYEIRETRPWTPVAGADPGDNKSQGEAYFAKFCDDRGIKYTYQWSTPECRNINPLPFDFMIDMGAYKILVEIDGEPHYRFIEHFHKTYTNFMSRVKCDVIKTKYARKRANDDIPIYLLRIPSQAGRLLLNDWYIEQFIYDPIVLDYLHPI